MRQIQADTLGRDTRQHICTTNNFELFESLIVIMLIF